MSCAVLVLADLYPGSGALPELGSVPRLPLLEGALARAVSEPLGAGGWRAWLRDRLCADLAVQVVESGCWLATPVHYVAGLDTLRLHGEGLLRLAHPTQLQLADDFARVFAGSGWRLIATDAREMLLQGPALAAEAPDPARFTGQSTREASPQGEGKAALRRLQSEVEMWLHGAEFHGGDGARRLKVNGLWLWGQSYARSLAHDAEDLMARPMGSVGHNQAAQLYADDLGARACAVAAGMMHAPLPERWADDSRPAGDRYVVLNVPGANVIGQVEQFAQRWFEPALAALGAGHFKMLELVCGGRLWRLDSGTRWRFWRRRSHWLPELLSC